MGDMIGIFGGTFDPPHIGHCILAEEARNQLGLDLIYWVPAAQPPHKPGWPISAVEDRLRMIESITAHNPNFELSRIDVDRPGPHYAKDSLLRFRENLPDGRLLYLMGADSLRDMPSWRDPEIFVKLTDGIAVMQRPQVDYELTELQGLIPGLSEKLFFFPAPLIDISGQIIRQRVKTDLPFRYMVTPDVYDLILNSALYR